MAKITIDNSKCTNCASCVDVCPVGVFEMRDGKLVAAKPDECILCRACEASCPSGAIKVEE